MKITYYKITPLTRKKPTSVFRVYDDKTVSPEVYRIGIGWTNTKEFWIQIANGELTNDDIIPEKEALKIIDSIEHGIDKE